jgi:hypothetical protein
MKRFISCKPLMLSMLALVFCCFSAFAGGEHFQVYLNKKLVMVKHVSEPISVMNLLDKMGSQDEVIIHYSHCGTRGKNRRIALRNEKGSVVKEWTFSDAKEGMVIPANEIAAFQKQFGQLTLTYSSAELPKARTLASLNGTGKSFARVMIAEGMYQAFRLLI